MVGNALTYSIVATRRQHFTPNSPKPWVENPRELPPLKPVATRRKMIYEDAHCRYHHERRHRTHGNQPAPDSLRPGDSETRRGKTGADEVILPEPILVGRNLNKLRALAESTGSNTTRPISMASWPTAATRSTSTPR